MTPAQVAAKLRVFNDWRRGELDDLSMPDPREIGEAIDVAVEMIESAEEDRALCDKLAGILTRTANVLKGEPKPLHRHSWHDLPDVARKLAVAAGQNTVNAMLAQERKAAIQKTTGEAREGDIEMIDTKELRRLAQAAKNSCESVEWSHEFRSGRYSQGVIISGEENILIVCGANYGCWRDADDDGDSQFKALGDFVAAANPAAVSELLDRLEAAEKERDNANAAAVNIALEAERLQVEIDALRAKIKAAEKSDAESLAMYRRARDERDALRAALQHEADCVESAKAEIEALRAKITEMEQQEPVAWMLNCPTLGGDTGWILSWTQSGAGLCNRLQGEENEKRLYALPGAQPAPSVPDEIEREVLRACCGTFHGSRHRITCEKYKGKREPGDKP